MADTVWVDRRLAPPEPTRPLLVRPRLLAVLQQRFDRQLTTVVAGPGFGKTSLLAQAVAENRLAPRGVDLWLGCQPGDASVSVLAAGLLAALDAPLPAGSSAEIAAVVAAVAAAVWRRSPTPVALLVDDVHLLPAGSPGAALLAAVLDRLPANGHLVLAGRPPLPVPSARLAAQGQTVELGEHQLAFDSGELAAFAALRHRPPELVGATGGWPALAELTASVGQQRAWEFLWEELLAHLPAGRRRLLAALAVVGGGDAELAATLADAAVDVDELMNGLPLVAVGPSDWRTLHPLWGPVLAGELSRPEADAVRRRAALVLLRRGHIEDAGRLYVEAAAWDDLLRLIRQVCASTYPSVPADVLTGWQQVLPEALHETPEALLLEGSILQAIRPAAAGGVLDRAAALFQSAGNGPGELACLTHSTQISWWQRDAARLSAVLGRAMQLELTGVGSARLLASWGRVLLANAAGDDQAALAELDRIPDSIPREWAVNFDFFRALELLSMGEPAAGLTYAQQAVSRATATERPGTRSAWIACLWYSGQVEETLQAVPSMFDDSQLVAQNRVSEYSLAALWTAMVGDLPAAAGYLQEARTAAPAAQGQLPQIQLAAAELAYAVAAGRNQVAADLAQRLHQLCGGQPSNARLFPRTLLALIYVLLPTTRAFWDQEKLGPSFRTARQLARMLVAAREQQSLQEISDQGLPPPGLVRAYLPRPWAAELAVIAVAAGHDQAGRLLLQQLGAAGRPTIGRLARTASPVLARAARRLLAELPAIPRYRLQLGVLGPLQLRQDGQLVDRPDLRRERVRALLAYLVAHRQPTRAAVAAALWPDLDDDAAGGNLRVTLTYLHRLLEPDRADGAPPYFVRTDGTGLRLVDDDRLEVDVWTFDRLLGQAAQAEWAGVPSQALAAYRRAVALYRGEYLTDLPDADWAALERDRLRARFVAAAVRAGELLLATGEGAEVDRLAIRALAAEPYAESAYRLLMAAALARRDRAGARRAWQRCQAMLAELGADPEPATSMLARRLLHPTQVAAGAGAGRPAGTPRRTDRDPA